MFIVFKIYKKSALASIVSISASLLLAYGLYCVYGCFVEKTFLPQVLLIPVSVGLMVLAKKINDKAVHKKLQKSFNDPKLINIVKGSAVAAYSLYKNSPCTETFDFIRIHNNFAADRISDIISKRITEDKAVDAMRAYDNVGNVNSEYTEPEKDKSYYKNEIFTLSDVETYNAKQSKLTKKVKTRKICMIVFAVVLLIGVVLTAVNSSKKEEKEITPYAECVPGDYTAVDVISLEQYDTKGDFVHYYFVAADGTEDELKLSIEESQLPQIQSLVNSQGESEPVRIYGNYIKYDAEGYVNGTYFTVPMYMINGSLESQTEISSEFSASVILLCFGAAGLFVSFVEWHQKRKELIALKNRMEAMQGVPMQ